MALEIERRFLIKGLRFDRPPTRSVMMIGQGYVGIKFSGKSFRVRVIDGRDAFAEFKVGKGLVREEKSFKISLELARELLDFWCCHKLSKHRHLKDGWEIDFFSGSLSGIVVAEREFECREEAERLVLPDWLVEPLEITNILTSHRLAKIAASTDPTSVDLMKRLLSSDINVKRQAVVEAALRTQK